MYRLLTRTICSFLILMLLGGCWNRVEMNEIGIISATAVDWEKGKWVVSYQLVIPQAISSQGNSSATGDAPVNVFSTEAESIRKAIGDASREMSRKLYFAHNQIIVISDTVAKKGISPLLEIYMRNTDARETVSMFIAKGKARKLIEQLLPVEKIPGTAVQRLVENEAASSSVYPDMTMYRILLDLLGPAQATGIPQLMISGAKQPLSSVDNLKETYTRAKIKLGELGVISGDKLKGWLTPDEAAGVMWLSDKVKRTTLEFDCTNKGEPKDSSIIIGGAKTSLKPEQRSDGRWIMNISVKANGTLLEYTCPNDLQKPELLKQEEQKIAEEIKNKMETSWKAVSRLRTDIVGFGKAISSKYPKQWKQMQKDWNEEFPETVLNIDVKFKLARIGFSNHTFKEAQSNTRK
ncbi:Ger(x)C family spore germination protein [Paenibacillus sp. FSL H8-0537]|uniref:Ger(x)C family spore germination protein n=1 Tax=Paenibacillus sp. FSL H8-0537 TaxID=2921399 RepID=UPI003100AE16